MFGPQVAGLFPPLPLLLVLYGLIYFDPVINYYSKEKLLSKILCKNLVYFFLF